MINKNNLIQFGNNIDQHTKLYSDNNNIIRLIDVKYSKYYISIFENGLIDKLSEKNIILPTFIEEVDNSGCLWLRQEKIAPISYIFEWPSHHFRNQILQLAFHLEFDY